MFFEAFFLGWRRRGAGKIGAFLRVSVLECSRVVRITNILKNPGSDFNVVWAFYRLDAAVVPGQLWEWR